jgi:hypothetical protein
MNKNKIVLIYLLALIISCCTWFFVSDQSWVGGLSLTTSTRGFPFHFYENNYSDYKKIHLISQIFLPNWFVADSLIYLFVLICIFYIIYEAFKKNKWYPLIISVLLAVALLGSSIGSFDYCVTGFPIEFYVKCTADGSLNSGFVWFGWIFDSIFWFSLSSCLVAGIHSVFSLEKLKKFLLYKDIWLTILSAWITFALSSLLLMFGELLWAVLLAGATAPFLPKVKAYYSGRESKAEGKVLFFSKLGYVILGISLGFILISTIFNLAYDPGWFDFRDIGFMFLSYPLVSFLHFQVDSDNVVKRLLLYCIVFVNLIALIFIADIFGMMCIKVNGLLKNRSQK